MNSPSLFDFLLVAGAVVSVLFLGLKWLLLSTGRGPGDTSPGAAGPRRLLPDCPHCGEPALVARQVGLGIRHICRRCRREAILR